MAVGSIESFPPSLQPLIQLGMLDRELAEGVDSNLGFRRIAVQETINAGIGETITKSKKGRKAPNYAPIPASSVGSSLDDGLTPGSYAVEQYTLTLNEFADTTDVDWVGSQTMIADHLLASARNNGVQAAQSLERRARQVLYGAYLGGNSRVRTDLGASTTSTCHVDDIRGFTTNLVNGVPTPISGTNLLSVVESGTTNQTLQVSAATADAANASNVTDGISGILTFAIVSAPTNGDALIASNAPLVLRPGGKASTNLLQGTDVFTLQLIMDGIAYLKNQGVPPIPDGPEAGTYALICNPTSVRQLYADQDFKSWYAGRADSDIFQDGYINRLLGVTFIESNEVFVQPASSGSLVTVNVQRPILVGAECMIQGNWEGLEYYQNAIMGDTGYIARMEMVNDVVQIIRPPLGRTQRIISLTWTWIGDFVCPTDVTATTSIIPTASSALFKRAVAFEHAS